VDTSEPSVARALVSLIDQPIPGETGVRYRLASTHRPLTVSVAATDEIWVTVGCRRVQFTADEARGIAADLLSAAQEATVDGN
jgi:hypothetical protein